MSLYFLRTCGLAALTLLSVGCATVSQQAFDSSKNTHIKKVALLTVPTPETITVHNFGNPMAVMGGAIGAALVASSQADDNEEPMKKLLAEANFDFSREMTAALNKQLGAAGYEVVNTEVKRETPIKLLENYDGLNISGAQAILDSQLSINFGYSNVTMLDTEYRPHIHYTVSLFDTQSKKPVYAESVLYGYTNPFMSATKIDAPKEYFFAEQEDLYLAENKERVVAGLRLAIKTIAEHIASQLKRGQMVSMQTGSN